MAATSTPPPSATLAASTRVAVTFKDFSVASSAPSAKAGDVTFEAKNDGKLPHQLVIVKSDLDPAALPLHEQKEVDESKVQIVSRIPDFDSAQTKTVTAKLAPGKYVLLCNVPSHYTSGMFTAFTVN
ncbi:MAG: hypothetical protein DWI48_04900 [Chloroflexi bacterium]|nr:MAG: hypothetical protein DWI48_04900 [Chloroflexota bacterium]